MSKLRNAVAIVTGAASGIGRSLALEAARRGARVVVADLDTDRCTPVVSAIQGLGAEAVAAACDVTDVDAVQALAQATLDRFGTVNLVCNNAGVCIGGTLETTSPNDARWMFEVNVFGVHNGLRTFGPLLRAAAARSEFAHVLNTGSENSLGTPPLGPASLYNATKHAVLALSDNARVELAPAGVGVSILCPSLVRTDIMLSLRHRPDRLGGAKHLPPESVARVDQFMSQAHSPDETARIALDGIESGDFLIIPHPEVRGFAEDRMRRIAQALDAADARSTPAA